MRDQTCLIGSLQELMALSFLRQRRALRTASEKLRNRTSFSATAVQHSPATRVNRYIGRLIEARQTESGTSDLNFLTLFYRSRDRERRVRPDTPIPSDLLENGSKCHYTEGRMLRDCFVCPLCLLTPYMIYSCVSPMPCCL